jgi:hypothetical protein
MNTPIRALYEAWREGESWGSEPAPNGRKKYPLATIATNKSARIIQRSIDELLRHNPLNTTGVAY